MGLGEICSLLSAFCWAVAVILFKRSGETMRPFALNLVKNLIALGLMLPTLLFVYGTDWPTLPLDAWWITLASGVIGIAVADTLYFEGLNRLGASRMGVIGSLFSPMVITLSILFLGEALTPAHFGGFLLVLIGVTLVNARAARSHIDPNVLRQGLLVAVLSVVLMAVGIVMVKTILEEHEFLWVVQVRLVGGVVGMLLVMIVRRRSRAVWQELVRPHHWWGITWASILGTYLALMLWLAGYKYTKASIASVLNETASVFIVVLAWLFLSEQLNRRQALGVLVSFGGVLVMLQ